MVYACGVCVCAVIVSWRVLCVLKCCCCSLVRMLFFPFMQRCVDELYVGFVKGARVCACVCVVLDRRYFVNISKKTRQTRKRTHTHLT